MYPAYSLRSQLHALLGTLVPCVLPLSCNYSSYPVRHWIPQFFKKRLWQTVPNFWNNFNESSTYFIRSTRSGSNVWVYSMKLSLEVYPNVFNWVQVRTIRWMFINRNFLFFFFSYHYSHIAETMVRPSGPARGPSARAGTTNKGKYKGKLSLINTIRASRPAH